MTLTTIENPCDLSGLYADAPNGVRANMIFSADGAAAFRAAQAHCLAPRTKTCSATCARSPTSSWSGLAPRAPSDTARPLTEAQQALRGADRGLAPPPIAVVSRTGQLPPTLFVEATSTPIVVTSASAARRIFAQRPALEPSGGGRGHRRCRRAIKQLHALGMQRILCEGGPTLLDQLVDADVVDEICVTIAPGSPAVNRSALAHRVDNPSRLPWHSATHCSVTRTSSSDTGVRARCSPRTAVRGGRPDTMRGVLTMISRVVIAAPKRVLLTVALLTIAAAAFGGGVAEYLGAAGFQDPNSKSARGMKVLTEKFGQGDMDVTFVVRTSGGVLDPAAAEAGRRLVEEIESAPHVSGVVSPWDELRTERRA